MMKTILRLIANVLEQSSIFPEHLYFKAGDKKERWAICQSKTHILKIIKGGIWGRVWTCFNSFLKLSLEATIV